MDSPRNDVPLLDPHVDQRVKPKTCKRLFGFEADASYLAYLVPFTMSMHCTAVLLRIENHNTIIGECFSLFSHRLF